MGANKACRVLLQRAYIKTNVLRRFRIWESARLREEMTKLCSSLQNITKREQKARLLSIVQNRRAAL